MMEPSTEPQKHDNQDVMDIDSSRDTLGDSTDTKALSSSREDPPPTNTGTNEKENMAPKDNNSKKKNYRFDLSSMNLTQTQRDELCCLRLRFSFTREKFMNFYMDLLSAGWTYAASEQKYLPPDAIKNDHNLLTAKEVQEHLDYYSLAGTIVSDLWDASQKPVPKLVAGQEERWRRLRDDVIFHHYERRLKSPSENDNNDTEKTTRTRSQAKKKSETATTVATRRQPDRGARHASVTEVDQGAGMYMNKNKIQAKEKARKKSLNPTRQPKPSTDSLDEEDSLPFERLSLEECIAKGKEYSNLPVVEKNEAKYKEQFKDWRFLLGTNHSLLLYGFGSKRPLLNEFAEKELSKEGYALTLDGFDPEISMDGILDLLVALFLDGIEPGPLRPSLPGFENEDYIKLETIRRNDKNNEMRVITHYKIKDSLQRAEAIAKAIVPKLVKEFFPVFLVIHNLEGILDRADQEILSTIVAHGKTKANIPVIRLVASIDDVDAPAVLWNEKTSTNFRWMWREVHTYRPHTDELVLLAPDEIKTNASGKKRKSAGKQQKTYQGADRLMDVLKNLATRYTEVMQNLATLQLQVLNHGNQNIEWVDVTQLLQQCLNKCTVKDENQLRNFLVELEDHEAVVVQKQGSTAVMVRIPYSEEKLQEILSFQPGTGNRLGIK